MLTALAPFDGETILPLEDAKIQVRLTDSDSYHFDALESARDQAIGWVESYTGQSLQERDFLWTVDQFASRMYLPIGPVADDGIGEVSYYDSNGTDTVIDADTYVTGGNILASASGSTWPYADGRPGGVRVKFTAGFTLPADIPPHLLGAVKMATSAFFDDRINPDLSGAMRLADQFRSVF
jgi:uncharacterized phiE125 gp8 family phage protein